MKYLVDFSYVLNENTTFKYDADCNKFQSLVNTGVVVVTSENSLPEVKTLLVEMLTKFSIKYNISLILPESFNVKVFELHGVNDEIGAIGAIVPQQYDADSNVEVYSGALTELK